MLREPPLSALCLLTIWELQQGRPLHLGLAGYSQAETNDCFMRLTKGGYIESLLLHSEQGTDVCEPIRVTQKGLDWLSDHPDLWGDADVV